MKNRPIRLGSNWTLLGSNLTPVGSNSGLQLAHQPGVELDPCGVEFRAPIGPSGWGRIQGSNWPISLGSNWTLLGSNLTPLGSNWTPVGSNSGVQLDPDPGVEFDPAGVEFHPLGVEFDPYGVEFRSPIGPRHWGRI